MSWMWTDIYEKRALIIISEMNEGLAEPIPTQGILVQRREGARELIPGIDFYRVTLLNAEPEPKVLHFAHTGFFRMWFGSDFHESFEQFKVLLKKHSPKLNPENVTDYFSLLFDEDGVLAHEMKALDVEFYGHCEDGNMVVNACCEQDGQTYQVLFPITYEGHVVHEDITLAPLPAA